MRSFDDTQTRCAMHVYLVTDEGLCTHHSLTDVVQMAVQAGASCVQLREKTLPTGAFVEKARVLKDLLRQIAPDVPLLINDRVDVALAAEVDGVHVGQSDMAVADVRRLMPNGILGLSVQTLAHVRDAHEAVAQGIRIDYLGVGPIYFTASKSDIAEPIGLAGLREIRAATNLPLVAIGGIQSDCAAAVVDAGADGVAVVSAICSAKQPDVVTQILLKNVMEAAI